MQRNKSLYRMILIGLMAAMVFVATMFLKFDIPTPPDKTMIKLGNAVCVLSGLLLGGVGGGLASGIGSMIFDLTDPVFAPEAWITLIRFFLMGLIAGSIAHAGGKNGRSFKLNLIAAISASAFSLLFYIAKSVLTQMALAGNFTMNQLMIALGAISPKIIAGSINAVAAVVIAMILIKPLVGALDRAGLLTKIDSK
jgi:uncharacterized membrane protein